MEEIKNRCNVISVFKYTQSWSMKHGTITGTPVEEPGSPRSSDNDKDMDLDEDAGDIIIAEEAEAEKKRRAVASGNAVGVQDQSTTSVQQATTLPEVKSTEVNVVEEMPVKKVKEASKVNQLSQLKVDTTKKDEEDMVDYGPTPDDERPVNEDLVQKAGRWVNEDSKIDLLGDESSGETSPQETETKPKLKDQVVNQAEKLTD
jgi:CCR4-NOT transcriptional regulation complex NOT5 subunit